MKPPNPYGLHYEVVALTEPLEERIPEGLDPLEELKLRALCRIADNLTRMWVEQE